MIWFCHIPVIVLVFSFPKESLCQLHPPVRRCYSLRLSVSSPLRMVVIIDLISIRSVLESWGENPERPRRIEDLIFSTLESDYPANLVDFVDVFPASLHGFVGAISEHLLRDVYPSLIIHGETQSFLKAPWPGDHDITFIVHILLSKSAMASNVQRRGCVLVESMVAERNQCVLPMPLSTGMCDIYGDLVGVYNFPEMVTQGYGVIIHGNFSIQFVIQLFGYWSREKTSWLHRVSVLMNGWDKQRMSIYRIHKWRSMESTLLQRTRLRTNWYRVDVSKHVLDTMDFYCMIWKKNKMPKWHIHHIRVRRILEKENNRSHILLACKAYCKRKQRQSSLLQMICLQHMSHISAYVIICISLLCI